MRLLQRKQISVSAGSGKKTFFPINGIDKEPVRFYMQLPVWFPASLQGMILVIGWNRSFFRKKQINDLFQLVHVVTTLRDFFHISFEMCGVDRDKHLYPQLPEKVCRILRMMKAIDCPGLAESIGSPEF